MNRRGMSLVEIMITMTLIGVLGMIAIPSFNGMRTRGIRSEGRAQLEVLRLELTKHYAMNRQYPGGGQGGVEEFDAEDIMEMDEFSGFRPGKEEDLLYDYSVVLDKEPGREDIAIAIASPKEYHPEYGRGGFLCHTTMGAYGICGSYEEATVCKCD